MADAGRTENLTWPTSQGPLCWKGLVPGALLCPPTLGTWLLISLALGIGTPLELGHAAALLASVPWPGFGRASVWLGFPVAEAVALWNISLWWVLSIWEWSLPCLFRAVCL